MARYILSIDGGGLNGLIPALVLQALSRRIEAKAGRPVELAGAFDLIAGSGTGGLIAAGLASPKAPGADRAALTPDALVQLFRRDLRRASSRKLFARRPDDGRRLERLIDRILPTSRLGETRTPVLITACDPKSGAPVRMTSPQPYEWVDRDWWFRQAVRAAMAAPEVFEAASVQNAVRPRERTMLISGEVWAADPTLAAVGEAFARDWEHDALFVLSLGAGETTGFAEDALHQASAQASAQATSLQADALLNRGGALQYSRITGALGRDSRPWDASGAALKRLEGAARLWIAEHDRVLEGWATRLAMRAAGRPAAVAAPAPAALAVAA